ncbi:MAG: hypothetical protein QXP81_06380 [Nitrososphaerota archaeon]
MTFRLLPSVLMLALLALGSAGILVGALAEDGASITGILMDLAGGPNRICTCVLVVGSEYSCACQEVTGPHWFREPPWCPPVRTVTVTVTEYRTTASTVTVTSVSTATVTVSEQRAAMAWSQLTVEVFMLGLMLPLLGFVAGVVLISTLRARTGAGQ